MDIRYIRREGSSYVAYENHEKVRVFDGSFEAIIVGSGIDFGGVFFDDKTDVACWSQTWKVPGPTIKGNAPQSKSCIKLHEENREPVLEDGKRVPLCPKYQNGCIPSIGLAIIVPELGVKLWNLVFIGDEVTGKSDFDNSLYSFRGYYQKLLGAAGNLDDAAKFKIQIQFSNEKKRSYIKIPVDTDLHPDPEQAQRQYEAITKIWQQLKSNMQHLILTTIDPRLWSTPNHPLVKQKTKAVVKQKSKEKSGKVGKGKRKGQLGRDGMIKMQLKRKNLKPETRERLTKELAEIEASKNATP